jgi:hypothetical protein
LVPLLCAATIAAAAAENTTSANESARFMARTLQDERNEGQRAKGKGQM